MEATYIKNGVKEDWVADATYSVGDVIQLRDGRAAVATAAAVSGDSTTVYVEGVFTFLKTTGIVILDGGKLFWDHSANKVHYKAVVDRDFYVASAYADAASAATTIDGRLNSKPEYLLDLARDAHTTAIVLTAGAPSVYRRGGAHELTLDTTNEAQKVDAFSVDGFAPGAKAIVELAFRVINKGNNAVDDTNLGIASATHATDADSIAEHLFIHLDGNSLVMNVQSKDGSTTVAAVSSTVSATEGAAYSDRQEIWFDLRNLASVQVYINGTAVLPASTFNIAAAVGPLKLLAHVEKSANATPGTIGVDWLRARIAQA